MLVKDEKVWQSALEVKKKCNKIGKLLFISLFLQAVLMSVYFFYAVNKKKTFVLSFKHSDCDTNQHFYHISIDDIVTRDFIGKCDVC